LAVGIVVRSRIAESFGSTGSHYARRFGMPASFIVMPYSEPYETVYVKVIEPVLSKVSGLISHQLRA
jgi:hypothetical protein